MADQYQPKTVPALKRHAINSKERNLLWQISGLFSSSCRLIDEMPKRLKETPNGWRMVHAARGLLGRTLSELFATVPADQLQMLHYQLENSVATMRVKPCAAFNGLIVVETKDINAILNIALHYECKTCVRTGAEIDQCELRRLLMKIAPPPTDPDYGCGYADMVAEAYKKQAEEEAQHGG